MEISFVKFDPRAPLVGLRANTGAWFETETSSSHCFFMRCGALGLKGLGAYPHDIYIGFYHRVGKKYVLQKDLLARSTPRPLCPSALSCCARPRAALARPSSPSSLLCSRPRTSEDTVKRVLEYPELIRTQD